MPSVARVPQSDRYITLTVAGFTALALLAGLALGASATGGDTLEAPAVDLGQGQVENGPSITTDQPDYNPGAIVTLLGAGWQPAEVVHLTVNDDQAEPWTYEADVIADAGGAFEHQFELPDSFVALYTVNAEGPISGVASTTFTDANVKFQLASFQNDALPIAAPGRVWTVDYTRFTNSNICDSGATQNAGTATYTNNTLSSGSEPQASGTQSVLIDSVTPPTGYNFNYWTAANTDGAAALATPVCITGQNGGPTLIRYAHFLLDNDPPTITVPADIIAEATSAAGAVVGFTATATDPEDGDITPVCTPASGTTFALGPTTVDCVATDINGATDGGSFTVTVVDTTGPVVSCAEVGPLEGNTLGGFQGDAGYSCTAIDAVAGDVSASLSFDLAATDFFTLGATTVTATATDGTNGGGDTFGVTVADTTGPAVSCGDVGPFEGNILGGYQGDAGYGCTATDIVAGDVAGSLGFDIPATSLFGVGPTTVTATASDGSGNSGFDLFTVSVVDTSGPAVSCAEIGPLEGNTLGGFQGDAGYSCTATDVVAGDVSGTLGCDVAATSLFPLGTTTVVATASDGNGNNGGDTFGVTVADTTGPVVGCAEIGPLEGNTLGGFQGDAGYSCTATDIVAGDVSSSLGFDIPATSLFPLGTTTVVATASDEKGNGAGEARGV
jgi:hypothetical protein